ncbi:Probable phosphatase YcdX [Edwardsiella tarda]|nr:Probable phosphatase YcdX [Edwardsiella tarda]
MYPVDLHMHTVASTHAYSTLHDYIAQAAARGLRLFAITDHGPEMADAPHPWHFMNMRVGHAVSMVSAFCEGSRPTSKMNVVRSTVRDACGRRWIW